MAMVMAKVKVNQVYQTGVLLLKITYYQTINGGIFDKDEDYFDYEYFQNYLTENKIVLVNPYKEK